MKTIVLALLLLTSAVHARLGETPQECQVRYGVPIRVDAAQKALFFSKAGLQIMAQFRDGRCVSLTFAKPEGDLGVREKLSEAERETLMEANVGARKWKKVPMIAMQTLWQTEDEQFICVEFTLERMVTIMTQAEADLQQKEKDAADKAKLKDF